jgi:hypothetical protein
MLLSTTRPENLSSLQRFVGRTPWSAADALVGPFLVAAMLLSGADDRLSSSAAASALEGIHKRQCPPTHLTRADYSGRQPPAASIDDALLVPAYESRPMALLVHSQVQVSTRLVAELQVPGDALRRWSAPCDGP